MARRLPQSASRPVHRARGQALHQAHPRLTLPRYVPSTPPTPLPHTDSIPAQLALTSLLDLGASVRDSILTHAPKRRPQYHVKRALAKYTHWAMKDGANMLPRRLCDVAETLLVLALT